MNTVTELDMCMSMNRLGGLGVLHRYMPPKDQSEIMQNVAGPRAASIGVNGDTKERINNLINVGVSLLVFDVAHGDMKNCHDMVKWIKKEYGKDVGVVTGNIVTVEAASRYYSSGADCFRVGIGSGSACSTRTVAGVGYNQLDAIMNIRQNFKEVPIINDGGIRNSGDLVKVLAAGADTSFIGSLLAATKESCAELTKNGYANGGPYKIYAGMASEYAEKKRIARTGESERKIDHIIAPEGEVQFIPYKGESVEAVITRLISGLKHGMAYLGAKTIPELWEKAVWSKV